MVKFQSRRGANGYDFGHNAQLWNFGINSNISGR